MFTELQNTGHKQTENQKGTGQRFNSWSSLTVLLTSSVFFVNWTKRDIKYVWGGGGGGLSEENVRTERVRMERC